ncbi:FmdB family zinc ribbon protein [Leifsonia shinshuensis]|uniref:Putative FmdB family regulatory protein n=1 Tax=Leifsonia shinshuensis TaxID=150026 RepID=A0A853CX16_9MICO|nr:FmdB family zinc ribbon protein [Leifsonia shinshuensis]NYJ23350.1 putative FmdB family regulatory protein [Leifsonia shinshuensis]
MPTYSYSCRDCGHAFDIHQAFTDDALTVCPNCGGTLRKVFGAVGVTFNGSGFYRTDSRGGTKTSGGSAGSSGSSSSSTSGSSSSASGSSSSGSASSGSSSSGSSSSGSSTSGSAA